MEFNRTLANSIREDEKRALVRRRGTFFGSTNLASREYRWIDMVLGLTVSIIVQNKRFA